jgi:Serine-threonine protein kinase 19
MSLRFSAAHSSRIKKTKPPSFKRTSSAPSPYASLPRRKPVQRSKTKADIHGEEDDLFGDRLDDVGLVKALAADLTLRDVPQAVLYIRTRMFSPVPTQSAGMNSTRIADVLNFRKNLPPIVTISHVQALLNSPTTVEREIAEMIKGGAVRKMIVPGRGGMGEILILVKDLESVIQGSGILNKETKTRFINLLQRNPTALSIPRDSILASDATSLMHAGFLTSETRNWTSVDLYSRPGDGSRGTLTSINSISKAASGSLAAVGGEGAIHSAGGTGGGAQARPLAGNFSLAIPSIGPSLKLLVGARTHLVSFLSKARYREMTLDMLRERWDGGIAGDDGASEARKNRGQFTGVLPGRTRKWKQFYGLTFEFVLEECVGAGLIEVFETRSVGRGVRAI